jgi:hypothetical protein
MENKIVAEILTFYEALIRAQLNVIKQFRQRLELEEIKTVKEKRMSQMDMVYDILVHAHSPLHVDEIIALAQVQFDLKLDKESVVSALAKRIKRHDRFIKTGPNTYALIDRDWPGGRP